MGNHVVCLDLDERKIRILNDGGIPIHEPGVKEIVQRNVAAGRLQFTTDVAAAVAHGTLQLSVSAPRPTRTARPTCSTWWRRRPTSAAT